jgi:hypothetical protein
MNESIEECVDAREVQYQTRHERLREKIAKYCLPDQADKIILTVLADIQGYDQNDTYRNVHNTITELATSNLIV